MTSSDSSLTEQKQRARSQAGAVRARLAQDAQAAATALRDTGLGFLDVLPGATVSGYVATRSEIDPALLLADLSAKGYRLCLPVVDRAHAPLAFRAWKPEDKLVAGAFDIPVPERSAPIVVPDIMLVPLLAFDVRGFRLGYGGGFYDRTIEHLGAAGTVTTVGLAFAGQRVARVPVDSHDRRLDWILTQEGPFKCG